MKIKKLSERTKVLLWLINHRTERNDKGELQSFFVPRADPELIPGVVESIWVSGGGDASALSGMERAGLIERPQTTLPNKYVYVITEDGLLAVETFRQEFEDRVKNHQARLTAEDAE